MKLSVIIPVRNGGENFRQCLAALAGSMAVARRRAEVELIVVDDGSTDDSVAVAQATGAKALALEDEGRKTKAAGAFLHPSSTGHGPSAPRNVGARAARGEILLFLDADVAVQPDTLDRVLAAFEADPRLEACFGSYDDAPAAPNFLSQYKNLFHHFVHQSARAEAATFWGGCGAMRRLTFLALGGFDPSTYTRPSIEDIDLGYRLKRRGGRIRLMRDLQVKHLKRWTLASLLRSDIFDRGLPWTVLLWRESRRADGVARPFLMDLNLQASNRVSVATLYLGLALSAGAAVLPALGWGALACALLLALLNWPLYRFFAERRGAGFALCAIPAHWLYYFYNGLSFSLGTLKFFREGAREWAADDGRESAGELVEGLDGGPWHRPQGPV